jgi:hypothetical protein
MKLVDASSSAPAGRRFDRLALWEHSVEQVTQCQDISDRGSDPRAHDGIELDSAIFKKRLRPRPVVSECDGCPTYRPMHVESSIADDLGYVVRVDNRNFLVSHWIIFLRVQAAILIVAEADSAAAYVRARRSCYSVCWRLDPFVDGRSMALAGGGTSWSLANGLGGGKSDAFQAGVYGATRRGPAYLAAALSYTNHWMSTDRFAFAGDHLTASFNAQSFGARVESGYRFATIFGGLTPYAAIQAQNVRTPTARPTSMAAASRSPITVAPAPIPAANGAPASTACWRSTPTPCCRCARGSPGRTTG